MKIEIKHYDMTHSVEMNDDSTIDVVMDAIYNLVISTGYHKDSIQEWINQKSVKDGE
jgi:hypothetical protein